MDRFLVFERKHQVVHSNLKFHTREEAWSYVAEHRQDAESLIVGGPLTKFVEVTNLYKQLGSDFFRPKRLEFSAQGYFYNSLGDVKEGGPELGIGN